MATTTTALPSFDGTEGCLFLAVVFTAVSWGIGTVQVYLYFESHGKLDKAWLRAYVVFAYILDTVHAILLLWAVYIYLVSDIGNLEALGDFTAPLSWTTLFCALVDFQVQLLFIYRAWMLSNKSKPLCAFLLVLPLAQFSVSIVYFAQAFHMTTLVQLKSTLTTARVAASIVVASETTLGLVLVVLLHRRKSEFEKTNNVIERIMAYTIGTGLVTAFIAVFGLIASFAWPDGDQYVLLLEILPKIYFNCLLTSLNMRKMLRELSQRPSEFELSSLHAQTKATRASTIMMRNEGSPGYAQKPLEVKVETDSIYFNDKPQVFRPSMRGPRGSLTSSDASPKTSDVSNTIDRPSIESNSSRNEGLQYTYDPSFH